MSISMIKTRQQFIPMSNTDRATVRNLVIFTITVAAIGWIGWGLDRLMGNQASESLGMLLWIITPLAATLLLRAFAGDGWKDFGIKPRIKGNVVWYIIGLLVFPTVTALVLLIGGIFGLITFPNLSLSNFEPLLQVFALGLLPMFFKNILEELPWRGYLTPKIYSLRLNDFVGHLIVGLIWAVWHLPYFLFFLDRAVIQSYTSLNLTAFILMAIVAMISWAIVFGEIRLLTNSVWPVVLMHMVEDAFLNPLLLDGYIQVTPGMDWLISPGVGILSILFFTVIGIGLYQCRKRKQQYE
jgi:hypothetical protein